MATLKEFKATFWGYVGAAVLTVGVGVALTGNMGDWLHRLSYDLPFLAEKSVPAEVVMVYITDATKDELGEAAQTYLPRRYHARLLNRLKQDGVRLVIYDVIFHNRTDDDDELADAMRRARPVVVATKLAISQTGVKGEVKPISLSPVVAEAAADVGLAEIQSDTRDKVIRGLYAGSDTLPSLATAAARLLGRDFTNDYAKLNDQRWLNYSANPQTLVEKSFTDALDTNTVPAGYFSNRIVVVGKRDNPDELFPTPYGMKRYPPAPGPAIQAISALNLVNGDWLTRRSYAWELTVIVLWGVFMSVGLMCFKPWNAALLVLLGSGSLAALSVWTQLRWHVWWPWLVPVAAQSTVALAWSVGWQYLVEFRRRRLLRKAFAAYLSPVMADKISDSEFDLSLGGKLMHGTIMFTDLEGFTSMSEGVNPAVVSKILTSYFEVTTKAILDEDGTIIKYMGDAVMAVWGAPLEDKRHAERAVIAACGMVAAGRQQIEGRYLRTRVGINTGEILSGNLGSSFRFDYTCIGDVTNFASRLEGINKYLGTDLLIADATFKELPPDRFLIRPLGNFLVVGKNTPIGIHEVLGMQSEFPEPLPWLAEFAAGLKAYVEGRFAEAEGHFQRTIELRGGKDGPSSFYLKQLAKLREHPPEGTWDGVVRLDSK